MEPPNQLLHWRNRNKLTQVDAASLLGVSQPYLSLLEKGARPLTRALQSRLELATHRPAAPRRDRQAVDEIFRGQLSALGYPGFAHIPAARPKPRPDAFALAVLRESDVDSRVVEALLWVVKRYAAMMDLPKLVRQSKVHNLQNRMGFVLQASRASAPGVSSAAGELEQARLLQEATLCWDSMPMAARGWMRRNRSPLAQHWNILTRIDYGYTQDAA